MLADRTDVSGQAVAPGVGMHHLRATIDDEVVYPISGHYIRLIPRSGVWVGTPGGPLRDPRG